jgi:hypothetical protein
VGSGNGATELVGTTLVGTTVVGGTTGSEVGTGSMVSTGSVVWARAPELKATVTRPVKANEYLILML